MKHKISLLLCILILTANAISCISESEPESESTSADDTSSETAATEPEFKYEFADIDLNGDTFTFLNGTFQNSYSFIDAEMTGNLLDDAMWERNKTVEEMYNLDIREVNVVWDIVPGETRKNVMSNDNVYQAVNSHTQFIGGLISDNILWDLNSGAGFQFDEPWWDKMIMEDVAYGKDKAIYFAQSDISLHNFEMSWCMYFNRSILSDLQMELPYQLVYDGEWTYDELYKYTSAGYNLNGDESFDWDPNGNSIYGLTSFSTCITQSFIASGEKYITSENGELKFTAGSDKFYQIADILAKIYGTQGEAFFCNTWETGEHYEKVFGQGRAMFVAGELKGGNLGGVLSDMKDDYGIVPIPKFNKEQENYISPIAVWTYMMTVPVSNPDIDTASYVLDTLAYLSYRDVVPKYYDITLQIKNIRDNETRDMLDIIRNNRTYYTAYAFGLDGSISADIENVILSGNSDLASKLASSKVNFEASLKKFNEAFEN